MYKEAANFSTKEDEEIIKGEHIDDLDKIPGSLPLLDYVDKMYSLERNRPFRDFKILAVQHLLGSTVPFFSMLEKGGAKPSDIHIVGKAYSSHPLVVKSLQERGYKLVFETVFNHVDDQPYDTILEKHIVDASTALLEEINDKDQKGLIIDDGGKAIRLLHQSYPQAAIQFKCVEQTSRGARTVNDLQLMCPVINVARSDAKTLHESPVIARVMVDEFIESLKRWKNAGVFQLPDNRIILLGYGFIGEHVVRELLERGFDVHIHDTDKDKRKKAQDQGLKLVEDLDKIYEAGSVLIGSSGTSVLGNQEYRMLKPGTLLVNMASTDIEFSAWNLRPKGIIAHEHVLSSDIKYLKKYMPLPWRSLYRVQLPETYLYLANGGFPSDFSGKINPIPAGDIQLTSALLLGGIIQASVTNEPKLTDLDHGLQEDVIREYLRLKSLK